MPKTHPPRSGNHAVFVDDAAQDVGSLEVALSASQVGTELSRVFQR